ncbi:MAG: hypothetical protein O7C39_01730 [Bacteroidetes bacterium]|nr:hypothetical protein [Bacteroidota bacterium]
MNWRYAIGEVFLIVVGISIALGANSWYEDRKERAEERAVLEQIKQSLIVDLEEYQARQQIHVDQESNIITLIEHMDGDEPYHSELDSLFRSVIRWRGVASSTAPYEALKSRGFALVSDDELRSSIIYYYENQVRTVVRVAANDRIFVAERLLPYVDENFRWESTAVIKPLDYELLRKDNYYRSLCMMKLSRLQNFILPNYEISVAMIREIVDEIDAELIKFSH